MKILYCISIVMIHMRLKIEEIKILIAKNIETYYFQECLIDTFLLNI